MTDLDDLAALEVQLEAELARDSFADFTRRAWHLIEPARPFVPTLASEAVAAHLQAVGEGQIRRLLISLPPGLGKSTQCGVAFPAWMWTRRPSWRGIFASYAHSLALRDSLRTRRLIESDWYRTRFAQGWQLRGDQNRGDDYENTRSGRRLAVGVGGALTGSRADHATVDDSLNAVDARSKATRDTANRWFDEALTTRIDDPDRGTMIVIQQRLHSGDLIGHLLEQGGWESLVLPAEYDSRRRTVTCIWEDPRAVDGDLLAPELHSASFLDEQKRVLGTSGYSCQYLQNPSDDEGGLFQRQWWRFWRPAGKAPETTRRPNGCTDLAAVPLPPLDRVVVSLDAAFKDLTTSDNVAFLVIGSRGADRFVLERRHGKMSFSRTCEVLQELARIYRGATVLVEDKANGTAIVNALQAKVPHLLAIDPEGGKESRAAAVSPAVEAGQVYLPDGVGWLGDFVEECAAFPLGKHDDQVDALSQALNYMRGTSAVERCRMLLGMSRSVLGMPDGSKTEPAQPAQLICDEWWSALLEQSKETTGDH